MSLTVEEALSQLHDMPSDAIVYSVDSGTLTKPTNITIYKSNVVLDDNGTSQQLTVEELIKELENVTNRSFKLCLVDLGAVRKCRSVTMYDDKCVFEE